MKNIKFPLKIKFDPFDMTGLSIVFPDGINLISDVSFYHFYSDLFKLIPNYLEIDWLLKGYRYKDSLVRFMDKEGQGRLFKESWDYYVWPNLNKITVGDFMPSIVKDKENDLYGFQFSCFKDKIEESRLGAFFNIYYGEKPLFILPFILSKEDILITKDICIVSKRILNLNKKFTKKEIENSLKNYFGLSSIYFYEGEEKINNLFRLLKNNIILYSFYNKNLKLNDKIKQLISIIKEEESYLKNYNEDENSVLFYPFYNEEDKELDFLIFSENILLPIFDKEKASFNKELFNNLLKNIKIIDFNSDNFNFLYKNNLSLNSLISIY